MTSAPRVLTSFSKLLAASSLTASLGGCAREAATPLYEAECGTDRLRLEAVEQNDFSNQVRLTRLSFNDLPPLDLTNQTMSEELPYDPAVYGSTPWEVLDTTSHYYTLRPQPDRHRKFKVMLYLDPARYSAADAQRLTACLRQHGPAMTSKVEALESYPRFQLAGTIRGREPDFQEVFRRDARHYVVVSPAGRVSYVEESADNGTNTSGGGFADRIQMPGRVLIIEDSVRRPRADVQLFRNAQGQSLAQRFRVVVAPK